MRDHEISPVGRIRRDDLNESAEDSDGWSVYEALCDQMSGDENASSFLGRTNRGQSYVFALGEVHRQFLWNGVLGGLCNLEPAVTLKAIEAAHACDQPELSLLLQEAVGYVGDYEPTASDSVIERVRGIEYDGNWETLGNRYDQIGGDLLSIINRRDGDIFEL